MMRAHGTRSDEPTRSSGRLHQYEPEKNSGMVIEVPVRRGKEHDIAVVGLDADLRERLRAMGHEVFEPLPQGGPVIVTGRMHDAEPGAFEGAEVLTVRQRHVARKEELGGGGGGREGVGCAAEEMQHETT